MTFRKFEMPAAAGMLKNSRLARFMGFFSGGDHDLRPVQPAPMPVKLASTRPSHERMRMTPQKLPNYHRALFNDHFVTPLAGCHGYMCRCANTRGLFSLSVFF
jgi:hypothetical protein